VRVSPSILRILRPAAEPRRCAGRTAAATAEAVDKQKQRTAEAAAAQLEAQHRAEFAARGKARQDAAAKASGGSGLYAKHSSAVKGTNTFGLSDSTAARLREKQQAPEPEPEPQPATFGAKLGGMFGTKNKPSEREQLSALANEVGWDEDMLTATIEGFDGDLAQTRSFLEQQKAAS
jgi:hypothetical protein